MKLRSIALAGLLGGALLMTSGCSSDDVLDAVNDVLKVNVIHVANANDGVNFTVDGTDEVVSKDSSKMFIVEGKDSYTVSNGVNNSPEDFAKDSAHLYALCNNGSVLTDTATGGVREIEVLNLSAAPINAGVDQNITVKVYNGVVELATMNLGGQTMSACSRAIVPAATFDLSDVTRVEVNGVVYDVPAYDSDVTAVLDSLNDVDFDIVIFDTSVGAEKGAIVPLATAVELGKASS